MNGPVPTVRTARNNPFTQLRDVETLGQIEVGPFARRRDRFSQGGEARAERAKLIRTAGPRQFVLQPTKGLGEISLFEHYA